MRITSRTNDEQGVALITALLATLLATGLMAGMFAALTADQKSHAVDRDQSQAYAAAHAGLEKLTSGLAQLFVTDFSPSAAQITGVSSTPPTITGFSYTAPGGLPGSGYQVTFNPDANGNPAANANADITTGPFVGFKGLITPYMLTVTARSTGGSEVRLRREVQTVAVPVFQFGIFGEKSLSFHAGNQFAFGGRVHTNSHLYLAHGSSGELVFADKITAVGEVVRSQLENTNPITSSGHTGPVRVPTVLGSASRLLAAGEGSVANGPGSAFVNGWKNLSEVTYNTNIRNYKTGAKRLDLPLVSQGAAPIDLIRRPALDSVDDPLVFAQRYFAQASLRILLSDRATDITPLPTMTAAAPLALTGPALAAAGYVVGAQRTPVAGATGPGSTLVVAGGAYSAAALHTIRVTDTAAGIPTQLKLPAAGIRINGINGVQCTGKTLTSFLGCNLTGAGVLPLVIGQPVTAILDSGIQVQTTIAGVVALGANVNVPVVSTARFTNNFMWISERTTNVPTPMVCEGYTNVSPRALTRCLIPGVVNPQTTAGRVISTYSLAPAPAAGVPTSLLGGFIKIEKQNAAGVWSDVTLELLNLGFAAPNQEGTICEDPTPNAVIRLQRLRDNGGDCNGFTAANPSQDPRDYWPNQLFDAREATFRDVATTAPMTMGGVMGYVSIDVRNLARWFSGAIGTTGATALNNNGYIVYFSDRRGNHNDALFGQPETGEYGHEDSINSAAGAGASAPNGIPEVGEDRNENGTLQTYGYTPSAVALYGAAAPFNNTSNALTQIANHPEARVNRQVFFRRALKLTNGGISGGVNNLPVSGLTIVAENGIYVQGNYNATTDVNANPNRPAAIIGDSIVVLSNNWSDHRSFISPNDSTGRPATSTGYRFAMIAGKSLAFPKPGWTAVSNWGSDGGVHNFMRMLEDWSDGPTTAYRGSMVSLYTARQFIGIFKNNTTFNNVYIQGTRDFSFDTNFLTPSLLPPGTPMFRDINTLKFRQILRPNQ